VNVAVANFGPSTGSVQVPVPAPAHAPLQPVKVECAAGVAVSVTLLPSSNGAVQTAPQLIPVGELVTVPLPVPLRATETGCWIFENVAVAAFGASIDTVQVPVPAHAPVQPMNVECRAGVGVSVTDVPSSNCALHVLPQLIPAGELVTVPLPAPARVTDTWCWIVVNVAVTDFAASIVTEQLPVPVHAPSHPAKAECVAGLGVSVTTVP
jgi:hypothetical protein